VARTALAVAAAALLLAAPLLLAEYSLAQLSFICIYVVAGAGLMLLVGYTGQISLGHAAFLGVGAYTEAIAQARGLPFPVSAAASGLLAAGCGALVGLPALRLKGIYLAIATLAFGFIAVEVFARWEALTGGNAGMAVAPVVLFGHRLGEEWEFYYLCLAVAVGAMFALANLLRSPTGRALTAIRDAEIPARSLGIDAAHYKTVAFALSAGATGIAGALYAHRIGFISPEAFDILLSIELLTMILVGGLGSAAGVVFGAAFLIAVPQALILARELLPEGIARQSGLQPALFGLVLVLTVLFEPEGLNGLWLRLRSRARRGGAAPGRRRAYRKSERTP